MRIEFEVIRVEKKKKKNLMKEIIEIWLSEIDDE